MSDFDPSQHPDVVERLNGVFARIGVWSYDHRSLVLGACAVLLAGCVWLAAGVRFDSSMEAFFDTEDATYAAYGLRTGLLAMIPNISPIFLTLGLMGWIDLPLDYVRLLIASVAIGISVDDTIHHVTRFRLEFRRCGSYAEALRSSMADVGRALLVTSLVLVVGFLVMLGSELDSMQTFGALLAVTVAVALVADFLLMPALVLTFEPWGPERSSVSMAAEGSTSLAG